MKSIISLFGSGSMDIAETISDDTFGIQSVKDDGYLGVSSYTQDK